MKILLSAAIFFISINLIAQETDSVKTRKAQISFGYPVGSNGINSMEYSNNFSFNILYGLNGGVNGAEIGSILNYNKGNVKGFQLAGVANINTGYSQGFILSGVSNICLDSTSGFFVSGVLNFANQNSKGFQLATLNFVGNEFSGFQLGVLNYSKKLKGVQLGVVNFLVNGENALPIGIFSIVKNGHFEFELTGGEVIYSNLNYKMGVERFYTIYKVGYSTYKNNPVYSYGLGFGGNIPISNKQNINIDLTANYITYNNEWDSKLNLLNKVDFNYKYNFNKKLSLLVGPSYNVYITQEKVDSEFGTLNIPYTIYTKEYSNSKLFMWIGFNAGLSFKL